MDEQKPTYEELQQQLAEANSLVEALRNHEIDAIVGEKSVAVVRLREVEEQLDDARRIAEERARELEAFSYSVSHDLRAPLHVISTLSSSLRKHSRQLDNTANEMLQRIEAGAKKMNHLINDILRLSKISRHRIIIEEIDLSSMAKTFFTELQQQNQGRHVEVRVGDDLMTQGDAQLLTIALKNLFRNAWKYTSKEAKAYIEVGSCEQFGKHTFFIRDNGVGFSMEQADRLFQPFQRLHSDSEFPGTGIGLAIVQRVINRHGGKIWAESEVGKGATFYFTLG